MRGWKYERDDAFEDVYLRRLVIVYLSFVAVLLGISGAMVVMP